jgi:hypothetical protein
MNFNFNGNCSYAIIVNKVEMHINIYIFLGARGSVVVKALFYKKKKFADSIPDEVNF